MGYKSVEDFLKLDLVRQKDRNYVLDTLTSTISRGDIITIIRQIKTSIFLFEPFFIFYNIPYTLFFADSFNLTE